MVTLSLCGRTLLRGGMAGVLLLLAPASVAAQPPAPVRPPDSKGGESGTMPTSASVMTTFLISKGGSTETLELIVLWRGTPGWFATQSSSGSGGRVGSGTGGGVWRERIQRGEHELEVSFTFATRTAIVQGKEVSLRDANAILVDRVDSPAGPRVVGTLKVDARLGSEPGPAAILPVLGRSREILEYLRCDVPLPDARMQERLAPICQRILSVVPVK